MLPFLLISSSVFAAAPFGYTTANTSAFTFTNITNGGSTRVLYFADDEAVTATIPFTFNFYGSNYTTVSISENGLLTFRGTNVSGDNTNLTTIALVPDLPTIAVFWDDYGTDFEVADAVYYKTIGAVGSRQFIVQWNKVVAFESMELLPDTVTFQARLLEGNNSIVMSYPDVVITGDAPYGRGAHATVGIRDVNGQNSGNGRNLQFLNNTVLLTNGQNIIFTRTNTAPTAVDDMATTGQDQPATINVLTNDSDPEQDRYLLSVVSFTAPTNGTVTLNANGTLTYRPAAFFNGQDGFRYTMTDGQGGTNSARVSINVIDQNDPPLAVSDAYSVAEDTTLTVNAPGVLANDSDPDATPITAVLASSPFRGTLTLNENGSFIYSPASNNFGADSFMYHASDGSSSSTNVFVRLTVTPVNDPPVAAGGTVTTVEDTPVNFRLGGSDPDGDTLSYTILGLPEHGTLTGPATNLTFRPATNYYGPAVVVYAVNDGSGLSDTGTVFIIVTPINEYAPVAGTDSLSTLRNTSLTVSNEVLLANDTDADLFDHLTITAVSPTSSAGGTVVLGADSLVYSPRTNFLGADSFSYTVSDGQGGSATGIVNVTVSPNLRITNIVRQVDGSVTIGFKADSGGVYAVQTSTNLSDWSTLGNGTEGSPGSFRYLDATAAGDRMRFYRVQSVAPNLRITNIVRSADGSVTIDFRADPGGVYAVQASTNLVQWSGLGNGTEGSPGSYRYLDATAAGDRMRFYRIRSP